MFDFQTLLTSGSCQRQSVHAVFLLRCIPRSDAGTHPPPARFPPFLHCSQYENTHGWHSGCARAAAVLISTGRPLQAPCSTPYSMCSRRAISSGSRAISCSGPRYHCSLLALSLSALIQTPLRQQANQPGEVTRLLSANSADHLMSTVKTHVAPPWDMVRRPLPRSLAVCCARCSRVHFLSSRPKTLISPITNR